MTRTDRPGIIDSFHPGDTVNSVLVSNADHFYGIITAVDAKVNRVWVMWPSGQVSQHEPDEVMLFSYMDGHVREKLDDATKDVYTSPDEGLPVEEPKRIANKKIAKAIFGDAQPTKKTTVPAGFVGDPKAHGLDEPVKGGFSVMEDLAKTQHQESLKGASEFANLRSRRAIYYLTPPRIFRMDRTEINGDNTLRCPNCGERKMEKDSFMRGIKLLACPECGFKVTSDKLVKSPVEIEVKVGSRRSSCAICRKQKK